MAPADITFECPECKQHLEIDAVNAGVQLQCPTCSKSITVPQKSQVVLPAHSKPTSSKSDPFLGKIVTATVLGAASVIIAFAIWFFGFHRPYLAKIQAEQQAERFQLVQQEQQKEQEQRQAEEKKQEQERQEAQAREEQQQAAEAQAEEAKEKEKAQRVLDIRVSDENLLDAYIRAAQSGDKISAIGISQFVSRARLYPIHTNAIVGPVQGDPEKVYEIMQYVNQKLRVDERNPYAMNSCDIGCIGHSDLWVFRQITGNSDYPSMAAEIFLLRDLDPSSATLVTKTDTYSGHQRFEVKFKCTNSLKRCVCVQKTGTYFASLQNEVILPCADEDDAKRIGKALAGLIVAYGGKAELVDSSDSF
jgi:hypothetical protein